MKQAVFSAIVICTLLCGCTGTQIATKDELYRMNTNTSEEIIAMKDNIMSSSEEMAALHQKINRQDQEIEKLKIAISDNFKAFDQKLQGLKMENKKLQEESEKKTQIILDTVSEENKRLAAKIHSLEKPAGGEYETGYYHTVQKGESLSKIASQYNISVDEIMSSNEITDPNKIKIGQKIFIPEK